MTEKKDCELEHKRLTELVDERIVKCKGDIAEELQTMNKTLSTFTRAFPHTEDGEPDFGGHRTYHESLIKAAKAEELFWTDLRRDLLKKGILWGILVVLGLIVIGVQVKLGILKVAP